jgi:hypothetical protein
MLNAPRTLRRTAACSPKHSDHSSPFVPRSKARRAELDSRFLETVVRWNNGQTEPVAIGYEYLKVIARRTPELRQ